MKKSKKEAFGKEIYLLGKDADGINYWLEQGTWDCSWYWGFGYIETYTNNRCPEFSRDINSHSHFDSMFFKNDGTSSFGNFNKFFVETPLNEKEIWKLLELMKSFYIAEEYSEMVHRGGAHFTENPAKETIKSIAEYDRINKTVIPQIMSEIYKILTPKI